MGFHHLQAVHSPLKAQSPDLPRIVNAGGAFLGPRASLNRNAGHSQQGGTAVGKEHSKCPRS